MGAVFDVEGVTPMRSCIWYTACIGSASFARNTDPLENRKARAEERALFYFPYARVTLPERRQREQTATVVGVPSTIAFTLRILGFQERLVLRWEWETFWPNTTPFPQTLHFAILTPPHAPRGCLSFICSCFFNSKKYYNIKEVKMQVFFWKKLDFLQIHRK